MYLPSGASSAGVSSAGPVLRFLNSSATTGTKVQEGRSEQKRTASTECQHAKQGERGFFLFA